MAFVFPGAVALSTRWPRSGEVRGRGCVPVWEKAGLRCKRGCWHGSLQLVRPLCCHPCVSANQFALAMWLPPPACLQERTAGDRALWALGWVLVAVGLLQAVASIASQFI